MIGEKKSHIFTHILLWCSLVFICISLIWASYAMLDEVTSGDGKVIPSSQIQVIQNLEGGIVSKVFVKEGAIVKANQVLMQIDNTRFKASFNEAEKKAASLQLEILRLTAEMNKIPFKIPDDIAKSNPHLVEAEQALYKSRQGELNQMELALKSTTKELGLYQPLLKKGAVSEVEILQLQRSIDEIKGKIYQFNSESLQQLNKSKGELAALEAANTADKDRLTRTTVRSPVKGIVKRIKVNTVGGVIQPGMDIIEIVPLDDTLLIEAKIKPADIGFIKQGQNALVKLTAYDYSIYGGLPGKVEQISADTITENNEKNPDSDNRSETNYLIRVRTEKNYLGTAQKPLYIIPGMMAKVDILTGHKSVMDYLLKPILKAKETAMRER